MLIVYAARRMKYSAEANAAYARGKSAFRPARRF